VERLALACGAAVLVVSWLASAWLLRRSRRRRRAEARAADFSRRLSLEETRADVLARGEREAAWSSRTLADIAAGRRAELDGAATALEASTRQAEALEAAVDTMRDDLRTTTADLESARRGLAAASTRVGELETEIDRLVEPPEGDLEQQVASLRDELAAARRSVAAHATEARELRHRLAIAQQSAGESSDHSAGLMTELEALRSRAEDTSLSDRIAELEQALDAARARLVTADSEASAGIDPEMLAAISTAHDEAAAANERRIDVERMVTELRSRVAAGEQQASALRQEAKAARLEADRLRAAADEARSDFERRVAAAGARISQLEGAARSGARGEAAGVARDAVIADLEQRLGVLSSARNAELRRLNDKIASMERLYVDVEVRDRQITELKEELKDTAEARDGALAEVVRLQQDGGALRVAAREAQASLDRYAGLERDLLGARAEVARLEGRLAGDGLAEEVHRLRGALDAERERADRAVERAALAEDRPATYAEWDRRLRQRVEAAVAEAVSPLQARIDNLHTVVIEKEARIASLTATPAEPDDLTRIRGIGPKIAAILRDLEVTTFRDIAAFTDDDVERIGSHLPVYGRRIVDDGWIEQAHRLAD
jgi:predicted flap endonuclease-1-like 5' DNA nuclease/predicted  nucleic acid-binding Zn-ribbon protein